MDIKIKKATLNNVQEIMSLNQQLFDTEYANFDKTLDCSWTSKNRDYFKNSITKDKKLALIAVVQNKIVGYLIGDIIKAEKHRNIQKLASLDDMFVLVKYRSKGVGSNLCKQFLRWVKSKNIKRVGVVASVQNKKAILFYKKCGFFEHDIVMEKDL